MIQEEKESTELRAEEIETRVSSGSVEALNLTQLRKRGSIPTSLTALSLASASPPLSGRSTPKLASRSAAQDLDRMGVMTLVSALGRWVSSLGALRPAGLRPRGPGVLFPRCVPTRCVGPRLPPGVAEGLPRVLSPVSPRRRALTRPAAGPDVPLSSRGGPGFGLRASSSPLWGCLQACGRH